MVHGVLAFIVLLPLFLVSGCGTSSSIRHAPASGYPVGYVERGMASWYGPGFHGKKTANGEIFDTHQLTAAHRTLPLGSVVQVRSLTSGRTVTVRVNDRGPFAKNRILDLSEAGARALGMVGNGTDQVEIRVVAYQGRPGAMGYLRIQVASYSEQANAQAMVGRLKGDYPDVRIETIETSSGRRYRVYVGRFTSEQQAEPVLKRLESGFQIEPIIIRDDT
jgi:rare lipoprotein A